MPIPFYMGSPPGTSGETPDFQCTFAQEPPFGGRDRDVDGWLNVPAGKRTDDQVIGSDSPSTLNTETPESDPLADFLPLNGHEANGTDIQTLQEFTANPPLEETPPDPGEDLQPTGRTPDSYRLSVVRFGTGEDGGTHKYVGSTQTVREYHARVAEPGTPWPGKLPRSGGTSGRAWATKGRRPGTKSRKSARGWSCPPWTPLWTHP